MVISLKQLTLHLMSKEIMFGISFDTEISKLDYFKIQELF